MRPSVAVVRFTTADLTFAALLAPVLLVTPAEGYGAVLPASDELARISAISSRASGPTRGGMFALEMFRRHRRERWKA